MLVVGLTGGIATGKSTVSNLLKSKSVPIVDADVIARKVVEPGTPALAQIVKSFGSEVLLPNGSLDRKRLGTIIFNDESKRKKLNSIVHPAVRKAMLWEVVSHWVRGNKYCVVDVPLLIEGGLWKWVGKVVVVYCSSELQLQRLIQRDNSGRDEAVSRLNSQIPITEKVPYADQVLDNSGSRQDLEGQVDALVRRLEKEAGWFWKVSWLIPPVGIFSAIWTLLWRGLVRKQPSGKRR
ncbi:CoaE-domain-containing protein [Crucibulum laeve]|uniref:CoaE-domain-containing protein n=1 Tax=Crucibulum laeve TaxID=68775 RepID=A0A5C3MHB8_9AGAR|nr:CoaE-domain-containing protein [Crucibulum laeve]